MSPGFLPGDAFQLGLRGVDVSVRRPKPLHVAKIAQIQETNVLFAFLGRLL